MMKLIAFLFFTILTFSVNSQDLYSLSSVKDVKITFAEPDWGMLLDGLKQNGKERLIGNMTFNGVSYKDVGIRYKGNSSYFNVLKSGSSKLPFNIKVNEKVKGQKLPGKYETLKLSNVFRDPSFLREVLSYEIAGKYMPAPKANFARVYVNGTYLGLYNSTESVDGRFLKKHFGENKGILIKCDPDWNIGGSKPRGCSVGDKASLMYLGSDSLCYVGLYEMKTPDSWNELMRLCKILNKEPDKIESILNVDQTLWMLAYNNVLVNLDSYSGRLCHNYYLYQDSFGIFQPILWDMNLNFGGFRFQDEGKSLSLEGMQKLSPFIHYKDKNQKRPLITQLLKNDYYRKLYIAHVKTILEDNFADGAYKKKATEIQRGIDFYVKGDENKLYPYEDFKKNMDATVAVGKSQIVGLTELMDERTKFLQAHPLLEKQAPVITETRHTRREKSNWISCRVDAASSVLLFFRKAAHGAFTKVKMYDDGEHNDGAAGDGVYGAEIKMESGIHYYISAENDRTLSLSPKRASFEFHKIR